MAETVRLCEEHDVRVFSSVVDVRDFDAVEAFAERTVAELGKVDVLVSNAGIFTLSPLTEMSLQQFDETIDTNLHGVTVNGVCPNTVRARMIENEGLYRLVSPDDPTRDAALAVLRAINLIPDQWIGPEEVSDWSSSSPRSMRAT